MRSPLNLLVNSLLTIADTELKAKIEQFKSERTGSKSQQPMDTTAD